MTSTDLEHAVGTGLLVVAAVVAVAFLAAVVAAAGVGLARQAGRRIRSSRSGGAR